MKTTCNYLRFETSPQGFILDECESEPIAMSLEWPADLLIINESSGRAMARNLNMVQNFSTDSLRTRIKLY